MAEAPLLGGRCRSQRTLAEQAFTETAQRIGTSIPCDSSERSSRRVFSGHSRQAHPPASDAEEIMIQFDGSTVQAIQISEMMEPSTTWPPVSRIARVSPSQASMIASSIAWL